MTLSRSAPLDRSEHTWPDGVEPPVSYPVRCEVCDFLLPADTEPLPLCPGPKEERSRLERSRPPRSVSPDRDRKRSSSVTGETLVMIPELVEWMHGEPCFLEGFKGHACETRPDREGMEVCHLENRGRGHGDWIVVDGEVLLNVAAGCALAHDLLDGRESCRGELERSEVEEMAAFWAVEATDRCPVEPPEHYRLQAAGELV